MRNKKKSVFNKPPLYCWDIYMLYYQESLEKVKVDFDLRQLDQSLKHQVELPAVKDIVKEPYDALVVTDFLQKIVWVSNGFLEMTGYSKSYAIGKRPSFLQGPNTSDETKQLIKQRLKKKKPFTTSIINYKKNGKKYLCQIKMLPLIDKANNHTHYLAIERELEVA